MWKKPSKSDCGDGILPDLRVDFYDFKIIGGGTYGTVYKACSKIGRQAVALKKIKLSNTDKIMSMSLPATAMREILLLRELSHRNVVALRDVYFKPSALSLWLCFDHCPLDLRVLVKFVHKAYLVMTRQPVEAKATYGLPLELVARYSAHLFSGMEFIHKLNIIHRDLKPQNILMNDILEPLPSDSQCIPHPKLGAELKRALMTITDVGKVCVDVLENAMNIVAQIADFGLSRSAKIQYQQLTHEVVTLWYRSPEILLGCDTYTNAIDVWSLGCIIAEMVSGKPLFPGDSEIDTLFRIFRLLGTPLSPQQLGYTKLNYFQNVFPIWQVSDPAVAISDAIFKTPENADPLLVDLVEQ